MLPSVRKYKVYLKKNQTSLCLTKFIVHGINNYNTKLISIIVHHEICFIYLFGIIKVDIVSYNLDQNINVLSLIKIKTEGVDRI